MTFARTPIRTLLLLALAASAAHAQDTAPTPAPAKKPHPKAPQAPYNPNVILLDPAHGGTDNGAKLTPGSDPAVQEKDATLAFANRLKDLLAARGFTVLLTHEAAIDQLTSDQRAELANRSHAVACILLHAANGGHGIHLYTSSISPLTTLISSVSSSDEPKAIQPWGTAQAGTLPQSLSLAGELSSAFYAIRVPLVVGKASIAPIDSLTCPAVAVELAPLNSSTPASDAAYQQRIAEAMANGLNTWRGHIVAQIAAAAAATATPATIPAPPKPAATKKPVVPKSIPVETPDSLTPAPAPAPIERRPAPPPPDTAPTSPPQ